ncbi:MAG: hypothetical protein ACKO3V_07710, partial [Pirellula sp.]
IVEVHMLKGSLLEYNNITLEEGLWPEKAYWDSSERTRERSAGRSLPSGASRPSLSSRGELPQNLGTANQTATPGAIVTKPATKSEQTPAPVEPSEPIPLKKASGKKVQAPPAPKFNWGT